MILKLNKKLELVSITRLASAAGVAVVDDRVLAYINRSIDTSIEVIASCRIIVVVLQARPLSYKQDTQYSPNSNITIMMMQ